MPSMHKVAKSMQRVSGIFYSTRRLFSSFGELWRIVINPLLLTHVPLGDKC